MRCINKQIIWWEEGQRPVTKRQISGKKKGPCGTRMYHFFSPSSHVPFEMTWSVSISISQFHAMEINPKTLNASCLGREWNMVRRNVDTGRQTKENLKEVDVNGVDNVLNMLNSDLSKVEATDFQSDIYKINHTDNERVCLFFNQNDLSLSLPLFRSSLILIYLL